MKTFLLKINQQQCSGIMSCGKCQEYIDGFITVHGGSLEFDEESSKAWDKELTLALQECHASAKALSFAEVP